MPLKSNDQVKNRTSVRLNDIGDAPIQAMVGEYDGDLVFLLEANGPPYVAGINEQYAMLTMEQLGKLAVQLMIASQMTPASLKVAQRLQVSIDQAVAATLED